MAEKPFINGRDAESQISFILSLGQGVDQYVNTFAGGEIVEVPITASDRYVLFFPTPGVNFVISDSNTIPTFPTVGDGNPMASYDGMQNPAAIDLIASGYSELWIKSDDPQTMSVIVFKGAF